MPADPTIALALSFFAVFLIYVHLMRLPSATHMYRLTNRAHMTIFLIYVATTALARNAQGVSLGDILADGALGAYIYFSLYYAFVFPLIGLARNSISINLLMAIRQLQRGSGGPTRNEVAQLMAEKNLATQDLRESRLYQLRYLRFAEQTNGSYRATAFGRASHRIASTVLAAWNQRRL